MTRRKKSFENPVQKVENAGNQYFLIFLLCFLSLSKETSLGHIYFGSSLNQSAILLFGK